MEEKIHKKLIPIKVRKVVSFGGEDGIVAGVRTNRPSGWLQSCIAVVIMRLFIHEAIYFVWFFSIYVSFYNQWVTKYFKVMNA